MFTAQEDWFEPPNDFREGVPMFDGDQFGTYELNTMIQDKALISRNTKSALEKKQKRTILSAIFDDGKSLKSGIDAIFFVIKFLTKFLDKK